MENFLFITTCNSNAYAVNYATTAYGPVIGPTVYTTTLANTQTLIRDSYTFSNMTVRIATNSLNTGSSVFTLMDGSSATTCTISFSAAETGIKQDPSHTADFADGDLVCTRMVNGGASGNVYCSGSAYQVYSANGSYIMSNANVGTMTSTTTSYSFLCGHQSYTSTENNTKLICYTESTVSNLRTYCATYNGASATVSIRDNGATATNTVTVSGSGAFEDPTHTDTITAGQTIGLINEASGTGPQIGMTQVKVVSDGQVIAGGSTGGTAINYDNDRYPFMDGYSGATTQSYMQEYALTTIKAKNLKVYVSAYSLNVAGTMALQVGGADSDLSASLSATGNNVDTSNEVTLASTDLINLHLDTNAAASGSITMMNYQFELVAGSTDYPISCTASLSLSTNLARSFGKKYASTANMSLSPSLTRSRGRTYSSTTNLRLAPSVTKGFGQTETTTSSLSLAASVGRSLAYTRASTSYLSLLATLARKFDPKRASSAALSLATTIAKAFGYSISTTSGIKLQVNSGTDWIGETNSYLDLSTTVGKQTAYNRASSSALDLLVTLVRGFGKTVTTTTGLDLAVNIIRSRAKSFSTTANLRLSTTVSKTVSYKRATTSLLDLLVSLVKSRGRTFAISTGLRLQALVSRNLGKKIATTSQLNLSTTVGKLIGFKRATTTGVDLLATVSRRVAKNVVINTGLRLQTLIDIVSTVVKDYPIALTVNLALATSVGVTKTFTRATTAALSLQASVSKSVAWKRASTTALSLSSAITAIYTAGVSAVKNIVHITNRLQLGKGFRIRRSN